MSNRPAQMFFLCFCTLLVALDPSYAKEKITYTSRGSEKYEAKPESCDIKVFNADKDDKPDQAYGEIGIINYHDERHRTADGALKLDVALPKIKAFACKVGGDALIDIRVTEVRRLEFAMFNVRATVIRFKQGDQRIP